MPRKVAKLPQKSSALQKEAKYLAMVAVSILLLLAVLLPDNMGGIGNFFRSVLFGLFGVGAFVLPVGLLAVSVCKLIARDFRLPIIKIVAVYWLILSLLHIFIFTRDDRYFIFVDVYRAGLDSGGGIFGLIIGGSASSLLGVGAPIALIAAVLILLVLITGRSFVNIVGKGVGKTRDHYEKLRQHGTENRIKNSGNVIPISSGIPEKNPVRLKADLKRKNNIIEIEKTETIEIPSKIILVNEEIDGRKREKIAKNPLFARRTFVSEDSNKRTAVITFPDTILADYSQAVAYKTEEFPEDAYYSEDSFDINEKNGFKEIDESVILPVTAYESDYGAGLVVKGLVDGAFESERIEPLFAKDEDHMFEYDEYARASGMKASGANLVSETAQSITQSPSQTYENFQLPSLNLLAKNERAAISAESRTQVLENSRILEETLRSFRIEAKVVEVSVGPTVTRYDLVPGPGVKVSSISSLNNDLALSLAAQGLRIEAPVPGKSAIGIEIPNKEPQGVLLREILEDERFVNFPSKLAFAVGKDIAGSPIVTDVARMPHLLIAGATGSGKSVCINTLIASLLYKARPDEVKLLMIDPKVVELSVYNGIPHLLIPVVTEPKKASGALSWAVAEMEKRYGIFAESGCRDLKGFNKFTSENGEQKLPQIVIIIDELADLMMTCKGDVEDSICRLAQKARAAGIHLIVATQRPSVDVITGLIKANIPSRLAFAVTSGTDSRTVLDMYGAEKLLGKGDMLFLPMGQNKPIRVQGGFISDKEVESLVSFLKAQAPVVHTIEEIQRVTMPGKAVIEGEVDEVFHDAVDFLLTKGKGSTSMLQRQFRIGYNRASRLMDELETLGIVGSEDGVKPRKVTITREEYRELYGKKN